MVEEKSPRQSRTSTVSWSMSTENNQEADHWARKGAQGQRKLSSPEEMIPQHGKRYEASGMEASKTMVKAVAEP